MITKGDDQEIRQRYGHDMRIALILGLSERLRCKIALGDESLLVPFIVPAKTFYKCVKTLCYNHGKNLV